jgi:GAF domain-containing protein/HAMP domain-containing protein
MKLYRRSRQPAETTASEPLPAETPLDLGVGRYKTILQLFRYLTILALGAIGVLLALFSQTKAWQLLGVAGAVLIGLLIVQLGLRQLKHGNEDASGRLVLLSMAVVFWVSELFLSGSTIYLLVGGLVATYLVMQLYWPGRTRRWLLLAVVYSAYFWLVSRAAYLSRYPISQAPVLQYVLPGVFLVTSLAVLWLIARTVRFGSIRQRLMVMFVGMAVVPAISIALVSTVLGMQGSRQTLVSQLDGLATIKQAQINQWLDSLQADLKAESESPQGGAFINTLLTRPTSQAYAAAYQAERARFNDFLAASNRFESLFLVTRQGIVILSTEPGQQGQSLINDFFFRSALAAPFTQPPFYSPSLKRVTLFSARPVTDSNGKVLGVIAGRANLGSLKDILQDWSGMGATGETYLVAANAALLSKTRRAAEADLSRVTINTTGVQRAIDSQSSQTGTFTGYQGRTVVGAYHWVPGLQAVLVAERERDEALRPLLLANLFNGVLTLVTILLAVLVSSWISRSIARPLSELSNTAEAIAAGNLELNASLGREDEIGALARSFNTMTDRLRSLIANLEQRISERTLDLQRRTAYLEASAEVGRAAATLLETDQLITQVVDLIRQRFDLYYVGLFLVDESGGQAVLKAGTGLAGQAMLARRHRIEVGKGMVGWAIANNQARVAQEAATDHVRLHTPELPETKSEAALPLRSRGRVLGALSVQSRQPNDFDEATLSVLQTMADQVAIALDNARLFAESQEALLATRRAYGELSQEAWRDLMAHRRTRGYRRDQRGLAPIQQAAQAADEAFLQRLPLKVREREIGTVAARKAANAGGWSTEELQLLETLTEQVGLALESARLHSETQLLAERERLTGEITARMRETLDIDRVLKTAVQEFRRVLNLAEAEVRLSPDGSVREDRPDA